jgi:hypothetical protein
LTLATYKSPEELYRASGEEVNPLRPFFTGDVFAQVVTSEAAGASMAMIVGHPCSMRSGGRLSDRLLMATVREQPALPPSAWECGHYAKMPLPDVVEAGRLHVAHLDDIGMLQTDRLRSARRIACLSEFGVNMLQQRVVWHLTRLEVQTFTFHEAFAHTQDEADLLEEWNDVVCTAGVREVDAIAAFEQFVRADRGAGKSLQDNLKDPQLRSAVRATCRAEARRVAEEGKVT